MRTRTLRIRSGALAFAALFIGGCASFSSDGGFGTVETAVEAMKAGATDFILKPFNINNMISRVRQILKLPDGAPHA